MEILRRFFGTKKGPGIDNDKTNPSARAIVSPDTQPVRPPALEITPPEMNLTLLSPQAPVIQPPPKENHVNEDLTPGRVESMALASGTRQLPPIETVEASIAKSGKHIMYGISSDVGMMRSNNQDALFAMLASNVSSDGQPDFAIFVVADGMGGHHDGEKASAITARLVGKYILDKFFMPMLNRHKDDFDGPPISEIIIQAVQEANKAVSDEIPEGGTTVTAVAIVGSRAYFGHVGDSRAYIITPNDIDQVTRDHSLVRRLIELDQLTEEEAAVHPQRNVLYRAVGQSENLEVDTGTRSLPPGSRLLLCSDGLWNQIENANLLQIVMAAHTPQEACDRLISIANERGGPDNITCILVQIPG